VRNLVNAIVLPAMKSWSAASGSRLRVLPRPTDAPHAHAPGGHADRVLILGSGIAVGWGETSHDTALPGAIARSLALRTSHGANVDVICSTTMTAHTALAALQGIALSEYDAVIVTLGMVEAFDLGSIREWRRDLTALVDFIEARSSINSRVVLVGLPPLRALAAQGGAMGSIAERHALALNDVLFDLSEEFTTAQYVALSDTVIPITAGDGDGYAEWADAIAESLAPMLKVSAL